MRISDWSSDVCSSDLTRSSWRERQRRRPALGCALASRIPAAMTAAHVTNFPFACVSWLVLALPMQPAAADPCPVPRAHPASPAVPSPLAPPARPAPQLLSHPFLSPQIRTPPFG